MINNSSSNRSSSNNSNNSSLNNRNNKKYKISRIQMPDFRLLGLSLDKNN